MTRSPALSRADLRQRTTGDLRRLAADDTQDHLTRVMARAIVRDRTAHLPR